MSDSESDAENMGGAFNELMSVSTALGWEEGDNNMNNAGGAGGGAAYVNFEQTNFPVSSTGDGLHTFTIAAGASWNVASNPADGTCTNLHYNGSGWDNVTLGTGSTSAYTSFNAEYSSGGRG